MNPMAYLTLMGVLVGILMNRVLTSSLCDLLSCNSGKERDCMRVWMLLVLTVIDSSVEKDALARCIRLSYLQGHKNLITIKKFFLSSYLTT